MTEMSREDSVAGALGLNSGRSRPGAKSVARMKAESQVEVLKRKLGTLEQIRGELGLSRREISQLLLVDPSAWSRWTSPGHDAPPIVYRALAWYLAIEDKYPALDVSFWLQALPARAHLEGVEWEQLRNRVIELERELADVRRAQAASQVAPKASVPARTSRSREGQRPKARSALRRLLGWALKRP